MTNTLQYTHTYDTVTHKWTQAVTGIASDLLSKNDGVVVSRKDYNAYVDYRNGLYEHDPMLKYQDQCANVYGWTDGQEPKIVDTPAPAPVESVTPAPTPEPVTPVTPATPAPVETEKKEETNG